MTQTSSNSYLYQYQQKKETSKSRSLGKGVPKVNSPQQIDGEDVVGNIVGKLQERVEGLEVKIKTLSTVVTLLQRYTETKDAQYEKQKEKEFQRVQAGHNSMNCGLTQAKIKEFDILTSQFKDELKNLQKIKNTATFAPQPNYRLDSQQNFEELMLQELQDKLRAEINKKMEICIKLINSKDDRQVKTLSEKVNDISFSLNQLENECKRNRMMFEKDVDNLTALLKETSTQVPNNHSRITEREVLSKSPLQVLPKSKSKNSKSDNSISRGKYNRLPVFPKDVSRLRDDELRQALRKKKEHKQKIKSKNW